MSFRHKVLVEGRTQRAVARELGLARVTVRKYVDQAAPIRKSEAAPRPRPVWDAVADRLQALLAESVRWTGGKQRLTATRLHQLLLTEGHRVGVTVVKDAVAELKRQRREVFVPLTYRPGDLAEAAYRKGSGSLCSLTLSSIHFWNSSALWTVTKPRIRKWPKPQSCAQAISY